VINVQHRAAHSHSGGELEMITTVGEQIGCMLMLAHAGRADGTLHLPELVLGAPVQH
jgi:hypothetical protein